MVGLLVILGLCYLGLLYCGIMEVVDDIKRYKWRKRMKEEYWKNE